MLSCACAVYAVHIGHWALVSTLVQMCGQFLKCCVYNVEYDPERIVRRAVDTFYLNKAQ